MSETTQGLPQHDATNVPPLPAGMQIPAQRTEAAAAATNSAQSGLALASAIVAVIGFFATLGSPAVGLVVGFAGLVCAIRGFYMINRDQRSGRNLATFGLLASVGVILFAIAHGDSNVPTAATSTAQPSYSTAPTYSAPAYTAPTYTAPTYTAPTYTAPVETAPAAPTYPLSSFGSGTYTVGDEITPGQYVTDGGDWCYWERAKNTDGDFDAIIANGNAGGHTTVTIKPSDKAFEVQGTCTFSKR